MELKYSTKNLWEVFNHNEVFLFSDSYKDFISKAKTEREAVNYLHKEAEAKGFKDLFQNEMGNKVFAINDNKNILLIREGSESVENGLNFIFAHIDSPRIDIKQNPIYEGADIVLFKTHYYGGIKKYQWVTIPLALHGVIILKDGTKLELNIGEEENDPIFVISDLLPHLARKQMEQNAREVIQGEALDPIIGSIPDSESEKDKFKMKILKILNEKYGIVEEDFMSAELTLVPAEKARDVGFDRSAIASYGHDDRICAFTAAKALFDVENPKKTIAVMLFDKEEIGSDGITGAQSDFLDYAIEKYMSMTGIKNVSVREALHKSYGISADVNAALDPLYRDVFDEQNSAIFGHGVVITKFTGSGGKYSASDASAELVFKIRKLFNENNVPFQVGELGKVDIGGGGTVAKFMAEKGISIIDIGPALLSMHAPFEIVSKVDLYSTYIGYKIFLEKFG
ncbi:MAG: aminopeptidase [Caldisericaceae bacterium]